MLRARVERLRRRAERLGLRPPELLELDERRRETGTELSLVELHGAVPRLDGWRAVAELHHGEATTQVEVVPGAELPPGDWQDASPRCDHCGLRRRRRTTVLLRHRSGDVAQVGTACLEDFTGERDPLASVSLRRALEEASGASASLDEAAEPTLGDFLAAVAAEAREHGFVAKADASDPGETTAERSGRRLAAGGEVGEDDRGLGHEALAAPLLDLPDPLFAERAGPILDLYEGRFEGERLHPGDYVVCAVEKPSIQARRRKHETLPAAPGSGQKVEHEYERMGALCYLAAWDSRRAKLFDRCAPKDGIEPFDALVEQFMSQHPYKAAQRVFLVVDNGSAHRGKRSIDRLQGAWPNLIVVHTPVHASWLR